MKKLLLSFLLMTLTIGSTWAKDTSYTFTSKSWAATCNGQTANWESGKDGSQYNSGNQGVQVTTGVSGANATSPIEFTDVTDITVTYCTNASKGEGSIVLQVGETDFGTINVTKPSSGGTTLKSKKVSHTAVSGKVKMTVNCTTNSIYINSITITESDGNKQTVTMSWSENECEAILGSTENAFPTLTVTPVVTPITYASSNESVATIANDGTVNILADGKTTITASFAGNEDYKAASAKYELVVVDPNRTYETFIFNTVAGLAELNFTAPASGATTVTEPFMKGIVTITNSNDGDNETAVGITDGILTLRLYQKNTLTVSVPNEFVITNIVSEATDKNGSSKTVDWTINNNTATYTANAQVRFLTITVNYKAVPTPVTLTIGSTGYATMYYDDRNLTVPAGVAGWTFAASGKVLNATESYKAGDVIPAGEAVVLFTVDPKEYTFAVAATAGEKVAGNMLKGTDAATDVTPTGTAYVLGVLDNVVAFYKKTGTFNNGAHKAYLEIPASQKAPARIDLNFGDVSGINIITIDEEEAVDGAMYNSLGQKVDNNYKGLVIKNGKKFINK